VRVRRLEREQRLDHPIETVFAFFSEARNLEALTPSWVSFEVLTPEPIRMQVGTRIEYRLRVHRIPLRWVSRIEAWEPGQGFVDRQLRGPYRLWHHRHRFTPAGEGTLVRDVVDYALPLGVLGDAAHRLFVAKDLQRILDFRQEAVQRLLA
jgi:ligand-binding SRPBCC domain-containing protein